MKGKFWFVAVASLLLAAGASAQEFGRFRPTYFAGGVPVDAPVGRNTADMKFQIGASVPVARNILGKDGVDIDFTYTQISVWDFFAESSPFRDHSFMPGVRVGVPAGKGSLAFGIEHRSNGRADALSRSVTYAFAEFRRDVGSGFVLETRLRAGTGWIEETFTQDVYKLYLGYADLVAGYLGDRLEVSLKVTPLLSRYVANVEAAAAWRLGKVSLFAGFNRGYGEALSDWVDDVKPVSRVRVGLLIGKLL